MSRRFHLVELKDSRFIDVVLLGFGIPHEPAKEKRVVKSGIVIAPIADVLHRACSRYRRLELVRLGDKPVGHVSPVAVATNRHLLGIGATSLHQRFDPAENVASMY